MATADSSNLIYVPGRLVKPPTDLSAAFPYGGTALGSAAEIIFQPNLETHEIRAEEFGGEIIERLYGTETALLGALMRGYDDDALAAIFQDTAAGGKTGARVVSFPGSTRAGSLGSALSFKLFFAPLDEEHHPALLIYKAIPLIEASARLRFSAGEEWGYPVMFQGIRDGSSRVYAMGRMEDLTL